MVGKGQSLWEKQEQQSPQRSLGSVRAVPSQAVGAVQSDTFLATLLTKAAFNVVLFFLSLFILKSV